MEKVPHSHRYRLLAEGYRLCVVYLKLFEKIYAPLTAGLLKPFPAEALAPQGQARATGQALSGRHPSSRQPA